MDSPIADEQLRKFLVTNTRTVLSYVEQVIKTEAEIAHLELQLARNKNQLETQHADMVRQIDAFVEIGLCSTIFNDRSSYGDFGYQRFLAKFRIQPTDDNKAAVYRLYQAVHRRLYDEDKTEGD